MSRTPAGGRDIRETDHELADFNLTHLQFQTLALAAWLGRSGEPVTQAQLSRAGDVAPMQVSHMMDEGAGEQGLDIQTPQLLGCAREKRRDHGLWAGGAAARAAGHDRTSTTDVR